MAIVVYTSVFGYTDPLHEPEAGGRFVCFTDQPIESRRWEIVRVDNVKRPTREARCFKANPHGLFPEADWWIWQDANFTLTVSPEQLVEQYPHDITTFRHQDRDRITDEAREIIRLNKATASRIERQLAHYRSMGWDTDTDPQTVLSQTGVMIRRNTGRVALFNELWWNEIDLRSLRDQMSVDWAANAAGLRIHHFRGTHRSNGFCRFTFYRRPTNDH